MGGWVKVWVTKEKWIWVNLERQEFSFERPEAKEAEVP